MSSMNAWRTKRFVLLRYLLALILPLAAGNVCSAYGGAQPTPFTMIIMNDPQYPWWTASTASPYSAIDLNTACGENFGSSDLRLRDPTLASDVETDCHDSNGIEAEWDSDNSTCSWSWPDDMKECLSKVEQEFRIEAILGVAEGSWPELTSFSPPSPNSKPIDPPVGIIINGDLTAYFHGWQFDYYQQIFHTGVGDYRDLSKIRDLPVLPGMGNHDYQNNFDCSGNGCAEDAVEWASEMIIGAREPNFPSYWVQSYDPGSLSYAWSFGNYVFFQLHNHPQYSESSIDISSSVPWLEDELHKATAAKKYSVINMHKMSESARTLDPEIRDFVDNHSVVAVFRGHYGTLSVDEELGRVAYVNDASGNPLKNSLGGEVPVFQGAHSGLTGKHHKFLLAEFGDDYFTVASMDGFNGRPTFHNQTNIANNQHYQRYSISAAPAVPASYGFVAVGVPHEDVLTGDTDALNPMGDENDAGAVNILYSNQSGDAFGQQWTQGNLAASSVESGDMHGYSLANGDFNGDGYPDLAAGAPWEDVPGVNREGGIVSVVYGNKNGLTGDVQILDQSVGGRASVEDGDQFGRTLAAGDFNGDGYDDLAVGAPFEDACGQDDTGGVTIFYGTDNGLSMTDVDYIDQSKVSSGWACEEDDHFGMSLAVGEFNGDAYDDLAVGLPGEDVSGKDDAGGVLIFFGQPSGISGSSYRGINGGSNNQTALEEGDQFGFALAAGDLNGDSYDDLVVGSPYEDVRCSNEDNEDDAGVVSIFYGGSGGVKFTGSQAITQCNLSGWNNEEGDHLGYSVAVGDFNGDGYAELAAGVPGEDLIRNTKDEAGGVVVLSGRPGGPIGSALQTLTQEYLSCCVAEDDDYMGFSLAAGDANQDGYADLAVGVKGESLNGSSTDSAGIVHLFWGSSSGLQHANVSYLDQDRDDLITDGSEDNDHFGMALTITKRLSTPPVADAGPDSFANEGDKVTLTGSFTDPDVDEFHTFRWRMISCDNGQTVAESVAESLSFVALNEGICQFNFTVTDQSGARHSDEVAVFISNVKPSVVDRSLAVKEGQVFTLRGSLSDAGVNDVLSLSIDWGDGSTLSTLSDIQLSASGHYFYAVTHQYPDNFEGVVTVKSYDGKLYEKTTVSVKMIDVLPAIETPSGVETAHRLDEVFQFSDPGSASDGPYRCIIKYGRSNSTEIVDDCPPETPVPLQYDYIVGSGGATVSVTVIDALGATATASFDVTVGGIHFQQEGCLARSDWPVTLGESLPCDVVKFTSTHAIAAASVNYGDGNREPLAVVNAGPYFQVIANHRYRTVGQYTVAIEIVDEAGNRVGATFQVDVQQAEVNIPPHVAPAPAVQIKLKAGERFVRNFTIVDPDDSRWTVYVRYADGLPIRSFVTSSRQFTLAHTYVSAGLYRLAFSVQDTRPANSTPRRQHRSYTVEIHVTESD